jgi:hypothetical protein
MGRVTLLVNIPSLNILIHLHLLSKLACVRKLIAYKAQNESGIRIWDYSGKYQLVTGGSPFIINLLLLALVRYGIY